MDKIKFNAVVDTKSFEVLNSEFTKARCTIMYTGVNRNNSSISKEAVELALPSLFNTPVVAEYIEKVEDFGTHGGKIQIQDGELKYIQTTVPYGVVPESANPRWEMVVEEDGTENEYLVADIILWSGRYEELDKTISEFSNQSMEINVFEGKFNASNVYEIDKFEFSALCILGQEVEPCFENAKITAYTINEFKSDMDMFMKKYKEFNESENPEYNEDNSDEKSEVFELTMNQKLQLLNDALADESIRNDDGDEIAWTFYWVMDANSEFVFVNKYGSLENGDRFDVYVRMSYSTSEDGTSVSVDKTSQTPIVKEWVTEEEKRMLDESRNAEIMELKSKLEAKEFELTEINEKYQEAFSQLQEVFEEERKLKLEEIFEEFDSKLSEDEEYVKLKENNSELSVEDVEAQCVFMLGQKNRSKTQKPKQKTKVFSAVGVSIEEKQNDKVQRATELYGEAGKYLMKN